MRLLPHLILENKNGESELFLDDGDFKIKIMDSKKDYISIRTIQDINYFLTKEKNRLSKL
jgi:hypothetical protein